MRAKNQHCNPEIWGGIECTIVRTADGYRDQLEDCGHYTRPEDIRAIANLGVRTIRYPVLWERQQPTLSGQPDWTWPDAQLQMIRDQGMQPVLGLLHHGSGPAFTSLDDPRFVEYFAGYAALVAARYPWADQYTPINEPLTTARFSGLYGTWYPHARTDASFLRMLINQVKGIAAAMKAIRKVNPSARLVQTEDLSRVHSTPLLAYQAGFENHRRWLTYDLLCGNVRRSHPLWEYIVSNGVGEAELLHLADNPCVPDVMGVNYYVTSERFLDHRLDKYPADIHGGNGRHAYVDVEAVRAGAYSGPEALLQEVHERYHLPIAITEVHLHCTREEQVRWLYDIWHAARRAQRKGADILAVTGWALLGAYDWDSLLTRRDGHYESGAYEILNGKPKLTAVGHLLRALATKGVLDHPILGEAGWWNREVPKTAASGSLLICGPSSDDGRMLLEMCRQRGIACRYHVYDGSMLSDDTAVHKLFRQCWGVIELTDPYPGSYLKVRCRRRRLPYVAVIPSIDAAAGIMYHRLLDLLIDEAIGMACLSPARKTKYPPDYVKE